MPPSSVPDSTPAGHARATQAKRRTRTREALLESAARGLSRYGYGNLVLEHVARDAGPTRGLPANLTSAERPMSANVGVRSRAATRMPPR